MDIKLEKLSKRSPKYKGTEFLNLRQIEAFNAAKKNWVHPKYSKFNWDGWHKRIYIRKVLGREWSSTFLDICISYSVHATFF